jgi:hypothetical protein
MPNQNATPKNPPPSDIGKQLMEALTQEEIVQLLDALFALMPLEVREQGLNQLQTDTRQTIERIFAPPADVKETKTPPASIAKLQESWSNLWRRWDDIMMEAGDEHGEYMIQEVHWKWEPRYFDQTALVADLEPIAKEMRPLIKTAFEYHFSPEVAFADAFLEMEREVESSFPEWEEFNDGIDLEKNLTACHLEGEWLICKSKEEDAFAFAERILECREQFSHTALDGNTFLTFFTTLSEADQRTIFAGLNSHRNDPSWQDDLNNTYSYWHRLYMYGIEQYAPGQLLQNLRTTIPQQWQNGLPVIEDFLIKKEPQEALNVIGETLDSLLKHTSRGQAWRAESTLLYVTLSRFSYKSERLSDEKKLLHYYKEAAEATRQTDLAHALALQLVAYEHFFDWQTMFNSFATSPVPTNVRQALFNSWGSSIIRLAKSSLYEPGFAKARVVAALANKQHR